MKRLLALIPVILLFLLLFEACGPGEVVVEEPEPDRVETEQPEPETPDAEALDLDALDEEQRMLYVTRSRLEDRFSALEHDMPEIFFREIEQADVDPHQGYRIQLLSTRDVQLADTTRAEFDEWAGDHLAGYVPRSYVDFRQPFYRVRVGDFHSRRRAQQMSGLIQQRFPDAWVVFDRVQPFRVPSDTVEFRIGEPGELSPEVLDDIEMMIEMDGELDPARPEVEFDDPETDRELPENNEDLLPDPGQ